jgi:hypothetical protein
MYGTSGFKFLNLTSVEAGLYTLTVEISWTTEVEVPDYTVRVYTDQIVSIKSSTGDVGSYNYAIDK